ncbi:hypothetical protein TraAM80_02928 [Trypanosoma rangeli]|uniref:Uncharacterized protein n=1 Tax=Trypanosoma rangeli TaxID=5698 RepID=A0A422NS94_TRYRA|nr:uncharacterized protein TraAM80_02928 [Trypanosoma rangeli]RNF08338.1 hypothetical protein TraAM80_02928 [Trypanosoma rangeli]|eukprot:RNF08338.1 hypothetical protein TraAM80_02928 [Trypanosoma rangeli]
MSTNAGPSPGGNGEEEIKSRRILSLEEYRVYYERQQRQLYQMHREANAFQNDVGASSPAAAASAASVRERWEQAQQPDQQQQRAEAVVNIWERIELRPADILNAVQFLGRVLVATFLLFRELSLYYFFLMLLFYMVFLAVQRAFASIRIERGHRTGARNSPQTAAPSGVHPHRRQRVSLPRKVLYVFIRCIASFLLSFSPTYSVEQLEAELQEDGIVGLHLHQD